MWCFHQPYQKYSLVTLLKRPLLFPVILNHQPGFVEQQQKFSFVSEFVFSKSASIRRSWLFRFCIINNTAHSSSNRSSTLTRVFCFMFCFPKLDKIIYSYLSIIQWCQIKKSRKYASLASIILILSMLRRREDLKLILSGIGTALTGVITALWVKFTKLNEKHTSLNREVGELKGRQEGIQNLSSQVLSTVQNAIEKRQDSS